MRPLRAPLAAVVSAVAASALAACAGSSPAQVAQERSSPTPSETVVELQPDPYAALDTAAQTATGTTTTALVDGIERAADVAGSSTTDGGLLYTDLATALESHVLALTHAFHAGGTDGWTSPAYRAASATVDGTATRIGSALGQVVGQQEPTRKETLVHEWRAHTAALTDVARGDVGDAEQAVDEHLAEVARVLEAATQSRIRSEDLRRAFAPYAEAVGAVAVAARERDPAIWERAVEAADTVGPEGLARILGDAVIDAAALDGDITAPATRLHADVASALNRDVWLTGAAAVTEIESSSEPEFAQAARDVLSRNTATIVDLLGELDRGTADAIGDLWRQQRDELVDLAPHIASGGDGKAAASAITELNDQLAARLAVLTDHELEEKAASKALQGHTSGIRSAVEAFGKNAPHL